MTKQIINIGTSANKGNGDPLRTAFAKVNENFTELYSAIGADVQIPVQTGNSGKYLTTNGTTLSWATVAGGSGSSVITGAVAPVSPALGDLWYDTASGRTYVYYDSSWVDANPVDGAGSTIPNQSTHEGKFLRTDGTNLSWVAITTPTQLVNGSKIVSLGAEGKLTLPAGTTYEYLAAPLTGHGNGLARLDFALVTDGVNAQWIAATASPAGSGYSAGNTFTFDAVFLGIPGASVTIEVLTVGVGGSIEDLAFTQPPLYPADIYRDSPINLQVGPESNRWTFDANGTLTLPGDLHVGNSSIREDGLFSDQFSIAAGAGKHVEISSDDGGKVWEFGADGTTTFPDGTTTTGNSITIPVDQSLTVNTSYSMGPGGATTFKINTESIKLPTGNGTIFSGTEIAANQWGLDSSNKTLYFPDAGDGVNPQIYYSKVDGVTGMELMTFAKTIKITAAQTNSWMFGADGDLTLPAGGDILDSTGASVLGGGGGSIVGVTSSTSTTYNVGTDYNWANWNDVREIGGFTASAIFYSVLKGLQAGDSFMVNETDSYIIDRLENIGAGATGYFNIFITTDSANRFASVNSLTFDIVSIALDGNTTIDSNLIINQNIRLKAGADIKDSTGGSVIGREPSFSVIAAGITAVAGRRYGVNTSSGAITVYLPTAPTVGDAIFFVDSHGTFATNNLTLDGSADFGGKNIMGQATQVVATDNENVGIFYNGTEWRLYA